MEYSQFEHIMSAKRMQRYLDATNGDTRKAMALYRYNLKLSQEVFTVVSCFEVALRNAIDYQLTSVFGEEWLKDSINTGGIFTLGRTDQTKKIIQKAAQRRYVFALQAISRNGIWCLEIYVFCFTISLN